MNEIDGIKIWSYVKKNLKFDNKIDPNIYNLYISKTEFYNQLDNNIIILTNNKYSKKIITAMNIKIIEMIEEKFKVSLNIEYKIKSSEKLNNRTNNNKKVKSVTDVKNMTTNNSYQTNKLVFKNFVTGKSNSQAVIAAKAVSDSPAEQWNPLFIYGDSGLGKTHLLNAIKTQTIENFPHFKIKYISSEDFGRLSIDNMSKGFVETEQFKNSLKDNDMLLIDDIQLLAKRVKTNEILFYVFNYCIEHNKQIVITSDKIPDQLGGFEKRLISRFSFGLSIMMSPPEYKTAIEITKAKLKQKNCLKTFSQEAIEFIAKNFSDDIRRIEGAINRMIFITILSSKKSSEKIEVSDIKEAFNNKSFKNSEEKVNIDKIKKMIAEEYSISTDILCSKSRKNNIVSARQLAMYLSRCLTNEPLSIISMKFGRKDHTTVMNAVKKIEAKIKINSQYNVYVKSWKKKIKT